MGRFELWKQRAKQLKQEQFTLCFACQDPRTPRWIKLLTMIVTAYAFSPIDLIPDFIPILGYLDDLLLLPLGIAFVIKRIPAEGWKNAEKKQKDSAPSLEIGLQAGSSSQFEEFFCSRLSIGFWNHNPA